MRPCQKPCFTWNSVINLIKSKSQQTIKDRIVLKINCLGDVRRKIKLLLIIFFFSMKAYNDLIIINAVIARLAQTK